MTPKHFAINVTLANGDTVPLKDAASCFQRLSLYLEGQSEGDLDTEWDPVYCLRNHILGRELDQSQLRVLREQKLINEEGDVDPTMKSVVLAAVRGQGRQLYLDSPFTVSLDRTLAELINTQNIIRSTFSEDESKELLNFDPVGDLLRGRPSDWRSRTIRDPNDPEAPSL